MFNFDEVQFICILLPVPLASYLRNHCLIQGQRVHLSFFFYEIFFSLDIVSVLAFKSLICSELMLCLTPGGVQPLLLPVDAQEPSPFVEKVIPSPFNCLGLLIPKVDAQVLNSTPQACSCAHRPATHTRERGGFAVSFEVRKCESPKSVCQGGLAILGPWHVPGGFGRDLGAG